MRNRNALTTDSSICSHLREVEFYIWFCLILHSMQPTLCVINTRTIQFLSHALVWEMVGSSVCVAWEIQNKTNKTIHTHTWINAKSLQE